MSTKGDLRSQAIGGVKWNGLSQALMQVSSFGLAIVLMNLLDPEDFGLVAMVTVVSNFFGVLTKSGLGISLIHKDEIDARDHSTVFFASLSFGIILAAILFFSGPFLADFYGEAEVSTISKWLSIPIIFISIGTIPGNLILRDMEYHKSFYVTLAAIVISYPVAFILAYKGFGLYSLVIQKVLESMIYALGNFIAAKLRLKAFFSSQLLKEHLSFGLPLLGSKTSIYWVNSFDNLIIGSIMGPVSLGIYSRGFALAVIPSQKIGFTLSSVILSSFARIKKEKGRVEKNYLLLINLILLVVVPFFMVIAAGSSEIIAIIADEEKWKGTAPILSALTMVGFAKLLLQVTHNFLNSQGHSKFDFNLNLSYSALIILTFISLVNFDLITFSFGYGIVSVLGAVVWLILALRHLKFNSFQVLFNLTIKVLLAIAMSISIYYLKNWLDLMDWLNFLLTIVLVVVLWFPLNYLLMANDRILTRMIIDSLLSKWRK
ncbi:lipopolysaccharide biosynthesis protein [Croceimicrobium hydrocarbonivorans]|uniref:Lipopolysaccharide biosynthesis protein n=1 Tax=Croceimicrobium hydrocarbonivorans TaxID=2761580 RepID=A0A7H0VGB0_9FLAO|nr:lipopolysaccharide biosynthesis protein [Croceimicrobium hydrocarbonivorans]QNR24758.1 lipopolysaccharide biosynthesis protein [Croceimicrobium hydrocarbonivorans]